MRPSSDYRRSKQRSHRSASSSKLIGASTSRSPYLIIDITGIKEVGESVAKMLVQMAMGLSLLGTRTIITGIRAEVAQTLMRLGLRLDTLVTKATLQAGVEHALKASDGERSLARASMSLPMKR